jgi:hypothetical protein
MVGVTCHGTVKHATTALVGAVCGEMSSEKNFCVAGEHCPSLLTSAHIQINCPNIRFSKKIK